MLFRCIGYVQHAMGPPGGIYTGGWAGSFKSVRQSIRNHMPVHMQALETRMRGSSEDSSDKSRHNSGPAAIRLDAPPSRRTRGARPLWSSRNPGAIHVHVQRKPSSFYDEVADRLINNSVAQAERGGGKPAFERTKTAIQARRQKIIKFASPDGRGTNTI